MKKIGCTLFVCLIIGCSFAQTNRAMIRIQLHHKVGTQPLQLDSTQYQNGWQERYTISKLKYYWGHGSLQTATDQQVPLPNYYLIDAADSATCELSFPIPAGRYIGMQWMLGVDSSLNSTGAQTDALDPINGMYWTWNSGYVHFKIEGHSAASYAITQKFEYHLGGFQYPYAAMQWLQLPFKTAFQFEANQQYTIQVTADINQFWQGHFPLRIHENALVNQPGQLAANIAPNCVNLFSVTSISKQPH